MSPDALNSLLSLCIGFALAGALTSGYQALLQRPAGFGRLEGRRAKNLCRGAFPGFCGALHHHAQYAARCADRTPPLRVRDAGDYPGGILEPDVGYVFPDDTARRRTAGLNDTAMPKSPPPGDQ